MNCFKSICSVLKDSYLFRFAIIGIVVYEMGLSLDILWHNTNSLRSHYFIIPHVVMYVGIICFSLSLILLKYKKYNIHLLAILGFPLMSIFDEVWHTLFGLELVGSPMMFWSPAHWLFGLNTIFIIWNLYKIRELDDGAFFKDLVRLLFFVNPVKFLIFILYPLATFTFFANLQTNFNYLSLSLIVFFIFFLFNKQNKPKDLLLPSVFLMSLSPLFLYFLIPAIKIISSGYISVLFFTVVFFSVSVFTLSKYRTFLFIYIFPLVYVNIISLLYSKLNPEHIYLFMTQLLLSLSLSYLHFFLQQHISQSNKNMKIGS